MSQLTLTPTIKQDEAYDALFDPNVNYVVFGGGAGGGKSWLGCEYLLMQCLRFPNIKCFIGRAELKRLIQSTYVTFGKVSIHHKIPIGTWKYNAAYSYIQFENGSRIDFLDLRYMPSDPFYERYGSIEYTMGFIEEGGEVHFMAFDVLKSRVGRHLNKQYTIVPNILITCNPKKNWIYKKFYQPWKTGALDDNSRFIQALYSDNPHTADDYGKQLSQISDIATKQRLMFGNWEYDDDENTMIGYDAIIDMLTNILDEENLTGMYISADIARFGKDHTKISVWKGFDCIKVYVEKQKDTSYVADKITEIAQTHKVPRSHIVIDEDGVGGGVLDNLRGAKGFVANSKPISSGEDKENYKNLKAQCAYILAEKITNREMRVSFNDENEFDLLTAELELLKSKDNDEGKLQIESKNTIKELLGRSPDLMDTFIMRMLFTLKRQRSAGLRVVKF